MAKTLGILALVGAAVLLSSFQHTGYGEDYVPSDTEQPIEDQGQDQEPLPPPNAYIPNEKKGIKQDIGRQGVGQIKLKDRPDSRTKKERKMGPSLPLVPNKG